MIIFQKIAALFDYPDTGYFEKIEETGTIIQHSYPIHSLLWLNFTQLIQPVSLGDLQEGYISSFDVKANTSLDAGHLLFGEDKKRNTLLVHLRDEHAKAQNDCGKEMPDYLPNLLHLMAVSEDLEIIEELALSIILPSLRLMKSGLGDKENPYTRLSELLIDLIEEKYPDSIYEEYVPVAKITCNFSKSHCHHG